MYFTIWITCVMLITLTPLEAFSRQRPITLEDKTHLKHARSLYLQTIALSEKGPEDPQRIYQVVANRFQQIGYSITDDNTGSHDIVVKVKCEERRTWAGPSTYGGDADSLSSSSRIWKGPSCQITYGIDGYQSAWSKEVRTEFENAREAARKAKTKNSGQFALMELAKQLEQDDFPLILTAEWGQADRLITLMNTPQTNSSLKLKIIPLLGMIPEPRALSTLKEALGDPHVAPQAALALGQQGAQATSTLLTLLETTREAELKIAAVKGLGEIATHTEAPVFSPLVTSLQNPQTEVQVQTEIVLALGKLADQRAVPVLETLNTAAWTDSSSAPEMQQLREALTWSLWQLNPDAHTGE